MYFIIKIYMGTLCIVGKSPQGSFNNNKTPSPINFDNVFFLSIYQGLNDNLIRIYSGYRNTQWNYIFIIIHTICYVNCLNNSGHFLNKIFHVEKKTCSTENLLVTRQGKKMDITCLNIQIITFSEIMCF